MQRSANSQQVRTGDAGGCDVLYGGQIQITFQPAYLDCGYANPTTTQPQPAPTQPQSTPAQPQSTPAPPQPTPVFHAVPFLRAYQPNVFDHFYTTDANEMANAVNKLGYNQEGIAAYVFTTQAPNTIPLYRMYNAAAFDHFYTTSYPEVQSAGANSGYTYEGIAAYVYGSAISGSVPFYRMYSPKVTDHFYTTSAAEVSSASANYNSEGIACYVLTNPT